MPKISELPTDTAPLGSDLSPFVDVSAGRTEVATYDNIAASAAFSGRYAPVTRPTAAPIVGLIGDSIMAGAGTSPGSTFGTNVNYTNGQSPGTYMMIASEDRYDVRVQAGTGGDTTTVMLARIQADIIDRGCNICIINGGWNDYGVPLTVAQTITNIEAMCDLLEAAGVKPVLSTMTPDGSSSVTLARREGNQRRNARLFALAAERNLPIIDFYASIVDVATGAILSTYNFDGGVHPNALGCQAMGNAAAVVLKQLVTSGPLHTGTNAADPDDMLTGYGFFRVDSNADGLADGYNNNLGTGVVASRVTVSGVPGSVQRLTMTAKGVQGYINPANFTTGWSVGDVIEVAGYFSATGVAAQIRLVANGSPTPYSFVDAISGPGNVATPSTGVFRARFTVPSGTTSLTLYLYASTGTGTCDYGRVVMRNLTTLTAL